MRPIPPLAPVTTATLPLKAMVDHGTDDGRGRCEPGMIYESSYCSSVNARCVLALAPAPPRPSFRRCSAPGAVAMVVVVSSAAVDAASRLTTSVGVRAGDLTPLPAIGIRRSVRHGWERAWERSRFIASMLPRSQNPDCRPTMALHVHVLSFEVGWAGSIGSMLPGVLYTVSCSLFFFTTYLLKIGTYHPLGPPQFCISLTAGPQFTNSADSVIQKSPYYARIGQSGGYFLDGRPFPATLCWMRPGR